LDQDASQPKWESVGIRHEESVGIVQEVMQREGIATALEGCSDTKPGWPSIGPLELVVLR